MGPKKKGRGVTHAMAFDADACHLHLCYQDFCTEHHNTYDVSHDHREKQRHHTIAAHCAHWNDMKRYHRKFTYHTEHRENCLPHTFHEVGEIPTYGAHDAIAHTRLCAKDLCPATLDHYDYEQCIELEEKLKKDSTYRG